jgi:hypothetical protein
MLTRREVEGQLRSLHPLQQRARRARRAGWRARHRLRVTVGIALGIGLAATLEIARMRAASVPSVATLQDTEWGEAHVGSYHTQPRAPLFPTLKRPRWDSYGARGRAARDPITGEARQRRLARE